MSWTPGPTGPLYSATAAAAALRRAETSASGTSLSEKLKSFFACHNHAWRAFGVRVVENIIESLQHAKLAFPLSVLSFLDVDLNSYNVDLFSTLQAGFMRHTNHTTMHARLGERQPGKDKVKKTRQHRNIMA